MSEAATPSTVWFVYLLHCRGNRFYCGITKDVAARWVAHQGGRGARFTRAFPPEALLEAVEVEGHATALKLEARIKRLPKGEKIAALRALKP